MKTIIRFLTLAGVILSTACSSEEGIQIHSAWVRPAAQGDHAAVYFSIHNHSSEGDELIGATSNAADLIELHESRMDHDVMKMELIPTLTLPPDTEIIFTPGGYHFMLVNIKQEFVLGDHIGLILHFNHHADIVVNVHIEDSMPEEDHGSEPDH